MPAALAAIDETDGRRAKGLARRRLLVQATLEVIARDGVAGLSHRAVAAQAGVPLATASYHFAGIDDLLETALAQANADLVAETAAMPSHTVDDLAAFLARQIDERRGRLIACYELHLVAMRRPELRDRILVWLDVIADAFAPQLAEAERTAFQATIQGLSLHALLDPEPPDTATIAARLHAAWPLRAIRREGP
jgi:DNA-binding transcriptional regulator YbjK